jgi:uroporphyrinogen decarboxylase
MLTGRERVAAALERRVPDRVPYCEESISRRFAERLMGWGEPVAVGEDLEENPFSIEEAKAVATALGMDNITYVLRAPVYAEKVAGQDGTLFYGDGHIRTTADLSRVRLPDPDDDDLYAAAATFARSKGEFSAWFNTRVGIFSTMLSMGLEAFSVALYDDRPLVERLLDMYVEWTEVVADHACGLGFDVFISTDDLAFKTAPFFSPRVFHELVLPRFRRVARRLTLPWVMHSDGNIVPFLDDVVSVGIAAVHPMEKGAVDIRAVKRDYGDRLCVLGNVDMNLLAIGTAEEVVRETYELVRDVAPGGGYILTSGNSLSSYCKVENVLAMSGAVRQWGNYPIMVGDPIRHQ